MYINQNIGDSQRLSIEVELIAESNFEALSVILI